MAQCRMNCCFSGPDCFTKLSDICRVPARHAAGDRQGRMVREVPSPEGHLETRTLATQLLLHPVRNRSAFQKRIVYYCSVIMMQLPRGHF